MVTSPAVSSTHYNFPYDDRLIFRFLSIFGCTAFDYDSLTDRIRCSTANRNWALCMAAAHFAHGSAMFFYIQLMWLERYSHTYLSSIADTCRSFAIAYSYQSLIVVTVFLRHRYAAYFNRIRAIDKMMRLQLGITPDGMPIRRQFWWFAGVLFSNYSVVSLPLTLYEYSGQQTFGEFFYTLEYMFMALMIGMSTLFLRYAAHCCLVRYMCLRIHLADCVGLELNSTPSSVKAVVRAIGELDEAKEILNEGLGMLLLWKIFIDGVNLMLSVYVAVFKVATTGIIDNLWFVGHVFFEWPFVIAHVWMMRIYQAIGDEVSKYTMITFL